MFSLIRTPLMRIAKPELLMNITGSNLVSRLYSSHKVETDEEFDSKWESYFKRFIIFSFFKIFASSAFSNFLNLYTDQL
jgi:hypothetical protein